MQFFKNAGHISFLAIFVTILSGCASLTPEQQKEYAVLTPLSGWEIYKIDNKSPPTSVARIMLNGLEEDVLPGKHSVTQRKCEIRRNAGGIEDCYYFVESYDLDVIAGYRYTLKLGGQFDVTKR